MKCNITAPQAIAKFKIYKRHITRTIQTTLNSCHIKQCSMYTVTRCKLCFQFVLRFADFFSSSFNLIYILPLTECVLPLPNHPCPTHSLYSVLLASPPVSSSPLRLHERTPPTLSQRTTSEAPTASSRPGNCSHSAHLVRTRARQIT